MVRISSDCLECKTPLPLNKGKFCSYKCASISKNRRCKERYATDETYRNRKLKNAKAINKKKHSQNERGFGFKSRNPFDIGRKCSDSNIYERREFIRLKYGKATKIGSNS